MYIAYVLQSPYGGSQDIITPYAWSLLFVYYIIFIQMSEA